MTVGSVSATTSKSSNAADASSVKQSDRSQVADFLALLAGSADQAGTSNFIASNSGADITSLVQKNRTSKSPQDDARPVQSDPSASPFKIKKVEAPQPAKELLEQDAISARRNTSDRVESVNSRSDKDEDDKKPDVNTVANQFVLQPREVDTVDSQKKLRSSLQDELTRIDQILSAIIQLLGASQTPVQATASNPLTPTTGNGVQEVGEAKVSTSAFLFSATASQLSTPAGTSEIFAVQGSVTGGSSLSGEVSLLKDIQSIVEQLQQVLQGGGDLGQAGNTQALLLQQNNVVQTQSSASAFFAATQVALQPTNDLDANSKAIAQSAATNGLATPADKLQDALSKLTQLLVPSNSDGKGKANDATAPLTATSDTKVPVLTADNKDATLSNLTSLIKSSINDVREQLQSLKNQNEAIFSQAKNNTQALGFDPEQLFKDTLSLNGLTTKDSFSQAPITYAATVAAQSQQAPVIQVASNTQSDMLFANGVTLAQQASDNSANTDSGSDGQSRTPAQPIVLSGASQPQSSTSTTASSFSRLLQQQEPAPKPVLEQVAFQVKTALNDGSSKITINLHPADLGKVDIKLSVDATGKTSVVVVADNQQTLDLLQRDAQGLAKALADAGLRTDSGSLSFNLGGGGQNQNNNSGENKPSFATYQNIQPDDEQESHLAIVSRSYVMNVAEGLDIEI